MVLKLEIRIGILDLALEPVDVLLTVGLLWLGRGLLGAVLALLTELSKIDDTGSSRVEFLDLSVSVSSLLQMEILIGILISRLKELKLVSWSDSPDVSLDSVSN